MIDNKKTVLYSEKVTFTAEFTDNAYDTENETSVAGADLHIDGVYVNDNATIIDSKLTYEAVLSEGIHTARLTVYDNYGNVTSIERSFTVVAEEPETPSPEEPTTTPDVDTEENEEDKCYCTCHSNDSFVSFFQKIIRFLRSLFGLNFCRQCKCPYT